MFTVKFEEEGDALETAFSEYDACQIAKTFARENHMKVFVYELWDDDNDDDDDVLRWTIHPDGTEEPGYMGSRQFV